MATPGIIAQARVGVSNVPYGRAAIYTSARTVTRDNVLDVLKKALAAHAGNRAAIKYLYDYRRGKQPILGRVKDVRPEICNRIVENHADEIVSFKTGYLLGEPIQYVSQNQQDGLEDALIELNRCMFANGKVSLDKELAEWMHTCGVGYRMVLPSQSPETDETPFHVYTLDPADAFVVYWSGLGHPPVMGGYIVKGEDEDIYCLYTPERYFEVTEDRIIAEKGHMLGDVPIIEYPMGLSRQGAFEIVLPLLDELNNMASNRMDAVEQFVQSLLVLKGAELTGEEFHALRAEGGIQVPADADVKYLVQELNQTQTQTMADDIYSKVLTICGMPNRNGGSSTSDTGSAVVLRDGWSDAETRAKDTENDFKRSERRFLRLALGIMGQSGGAAITPSQIEIRFTRRNYENIQEKAQVLLQMLSSEWIDPLEAYIHCGMFSDPELAYQRGISHRQRMQQEATAEREAMDEQARRAAEDEQGDDGGAVTEDG